MKKIIEIDKVGGIDADNDELLMKCFQNHETFTQLKNFEKFIILGRKGTGKTAIFKKILAERDSSTFSFGHTFSDYPWHYHDKQVKIGVPEFDKYTHSWKYLALLTISKILLNQDQSIPYDDKSLEYLTKIESFIVDSYGTRDPDLTQIFTPSKQLKIKPNFKVDLGILSGGVSAEKVAVEYLPVIVQEVNLNLTEFVINSLNPENRYYVMFDQLDLGFDPKNKDYNNRLIGLMLAARDLNNKAKELGEKLSVSVFLRDDIYDKLKFEDKNKLTRGYTTFIEWDVRGQHTLKQLMELRLTEVLKSSSNEAVKWEDVFDEGQLMTGRQSKYNYIADRTFLRPRDIIQFSNEIITQHKLNTERHEKIDNKEINDAKLEYSRYFIDELDDEIHKHIPEYEKILDVIKNIGYYQFDSNDFQASFGAKKGLFSEKATITGALRSLFEFSIIGYYKLGGSGYGGSEYVFRYKDNRAQFDENAKLYRVHPGLIETLGLKRSTKTKE